MNASFRTAFWAMCLGLTVPMVLFVGVELTPGGRAARKSAQAASDRRGSLRLNWAHAGLKTPPDHASPADSTGEKSSHPVDKPTKIAAPPQKSAPQKSIAELEGAKIVLGPPESDQPAPDIESGRDKRVPAAVTNRPRVEILPEPPANGPDRLALETRLAGIQEHLERLGNTIATQTQREPPVDQVKQIMELLRLLRQSPDLDEPLAQIPRLSEPETDEEKPAASVVEKRPAASSPEPAKNARQDPPAPAQNKPRPQPEIKIFHSLYLSGSTLQALIHPLLTNGVGRAGAADAGTADVTLETGAEPSTAPASALVVRDFPAVLKKIEYVIQKLDVPPIPVVIEATVITVRLNAAMPYGIDLLQYNASGQPFVVRPADNDRFRSSGTTADELVLTHGFGLKCGSLQGDPRAFINVVQSAVQTGRTHAWQINVLNRQTAQLMLNDPFSPEGSQSAGTILNVKPIVTEKGLVHLDIRRDVAPDSLSAGSHSAALTNQIVLRDGQTAVVAGFIAEHLATYCYRPRGFGQLPVVGRFFEKQSGVIERSETIVLLTPHVADTGAPPVARRSEIRPTPLRVGSASKEGAGKNPSAGPRVMKELVPLPAEKPARPAPDSDQPTVRAAPQPARTKPAAVAPPVQLAGREAIADETPDEETDSIPVLDLPGELESGPVIRPSGARRTE